MERLTTFKDDDLNARIHNIYDDLSSVAFSLAVAHVNTLESNNPFHFTNGIDQINRIVIKLKAFYPEYNTRGDFFVPFEHDKLVTRAMKYLGEDNY